MRIHSDTLVRADLYAALAAIPGGDVGISCETPPSLHKSRSRDHAYSVALRGHGVRHTRRPNTNTGGSGEYAATYDDWGFWLAELFSRDPNAIAGPYKGAADFERQTAVTRSVAANNPVFTVGCAPCYPVRATPEMELWLREMELWLRERGYEPID